MTDYDAVAAEADEIERQERETTEKVAQAVAAWRTRWPNHCKACGGWGGSQFSQSHPWGSTTASETLFEPCDALDETMCHRCGRAGLVRDDEDNHGPCSFCGWDCDDGCPEP